MMKTLTLKREDIYRGQLILVNAVHPIASDYKMALVPVDEAYVSIFMERSAAVAVSLIMHEIHGENEIIPISGYRTNEEQVEIYTESLKENGRDFTEKYVALPTCSEHQTGYAIDLALKNDAIDFIRPDFPYEGICNQFRKTAPKFGFIERYQNGKEAITGIAHEPWHFRFVGYPHSEIMHEKGCALEEYMTFIGQYPYDGDHFKTVRGQVEIEIFYVPIQSEAQVTVDLPEHYLYQVSGNNVDGFIVTLWRHLE